MNGRKVEKSGKEVRGDATKTERVSG